MLSSLTTLPGGSIVGQVGGMLMDLGISSMQVDSADRGFSFMADGPIDMRMDPDAALSAEEVRAVLMDLGSPAALRTSISSRHCSSLHQSAMF